MNDDAKNTSGVHTVRIISRVLLLVIVGMTASMMYKMSSWRPLLSLLKEELDVGLSPLATCVSSPWYFWLSPCVAAVAVVKEFLLRNDAMALRCNLVLFVALLLIGGVFILGVDVV